MLKAISGLKLTLVEFASFDLVSPIRIFFYSIFCPFMRELEYYVKIHTFNSKISAIKGAFS